MDRMTEGVIEVAARVVGITCGLGGIVEGLTTVALDEEASSEEATFSATYILRRIGDRKRAEKKRKNKSIKERDKRNERGEKKRIQCTHLKYQSDCLGYYRWKWKWQR